MDMTLEEQGAYRNLLDEAHLRGGFLPNDERILAKACGDALVWPRVRDRVLARFSTGPNGLSNETLNDVMGESRRRAEKQREYSHRRNLGNAAGNNTGNAAGNNGGNKAHPPVPVPVPVLSSGSGSKDLGNSKGVDQSPQSGNSQQVAKSGNSKTNARSKRPIFSGQRFVVFDWMLEDLARTLGPHTDAFDLHSWFFDLDAQAVKSKLVMPKAEQWPWLQTALITEAQKRGLPIASPVTHSAKTKHNIAELQKFARGEA